MAQTISISRSVLEEYYTDIRHKDKWVKISAPNTLGDLKEMNLYGILAMNSITDSLSMKSSENSFGGEAENIDLDKVGDVVKRSSSLVSDYLVYEGANNNTIPITMVIMPEIKNNPDMKTLIEWINKLIRPKPYLRGGGKVFNAFRYSSYFPELDRVKSAILGAEEVLKGLDSALGVSEKLKEAGLIDEALQEDEFWKDSYLQLHIGDNINITGLIATDVDIDWTMIRDEDGQFYAMTVGFSLAPYKTPDAETASKWYSAQDNWS
jgi:hypothetical protein